MSRNLRLSLSQWFFGSSGPAESSLLSPVERLLWFTLLLAILYGAVWFVYQSAAPGYRKVLAGMTQVFYGIQGKRFEFAAQGSQLLFRSYSRPAFEADLTTQGVDNNVPFLLTLLLITPGMSLRNRGFRLALGLLLLLLGQVLFVATKVEVSLIAAAHPLAGAPWFWNTVDNFFEITGKAFLPVVIWLLLGLPYMLGQLDTPLARPAKPPGRNAPCPCGSGKKYKHCCGG